MAQDTPQATPKPGLAPGVTVAYATDRADVKLTRLSFEVLGQPVPQGSARGYVVRGRAVVTSDNSELRPWRDVVSWTARDALIKHHERSSFPLISAVELHVEFWLRRPKSAPRTIDVLPTVKPDLDKLVRAIGDGLTEAGVIRDDALITAITTTKRYAVGRDLPKIYREGFHHEIPGVTVNVAEVAA